MVAGGPATGAAARAPAGRDRRVDLFVLAVEVVLVAGAALVGALLNGRGVRLHADAAPLYATWGPHLGWGTPAAVLLAGAVLWWGPAWATRASWRRLLTAGYLGSVAWTLALALVDGWRRGLIDRLTPQAEYLPEVPKAGSVSRLLAEFTGRILDFQPDSYATHAAGHPPGALLLFVVLDRIGLGGGGPAAFCCVLVGATVAVSVPVTLRALGDEAAARAVVPFLVLFPGAVWVGASADGIFAGVVAAGLALLAVQPLGRTPVRHLAALGGGLLLGSALYLSYGFVLVGLLAATVIALRHAGRVAALAAAALGTAAVVAAFTATGFWWPDGYHLVVQRYYQGWAADRPYTYWLWANLAALILSAGPAVAPALRRATVAAWSHLSGSIMKLLSRPSARRDNNFMINGERGRWCGCRWLPWGLWPSPICRGCRRLRWSGSGCRSRCGCWSRWRACRPPTGGGGWRARRSPRWRSTIWCSPARSGR
ncbi:hypothetical protein [Micromonospora zhanjiangensis]